MGACCSGSHSSNSLVTWIGTQAVLLQVAPAISPWALGGVGTSCSGSNRPYSPVAQSEAFAGFFLVVLPRSLGEVGANFSWLHSLHSSVAWSGTLTGLLWIALSFPGLLRVEQKCSGTQGGDMAQGSPWLELTVGS